MWEFAANHPGWFFLYMLIVVPCSAFVVVLLFFVIGDGQVNIKREGLEPKKHRSRPNASKVSFNEGKQSKNAGTTRH